MFLFLKFLVEKITEGIAFVAKQSTPSLVASINGVRKAMGVSLPPPSSVSVDSQSAGADQRDIESELSQLLGEDGVSDVMTDIFH